MSLPGVRGTAYADNPAEPGNLCAFVYGGTLAELFREHSTDDGIARGYEISRNDVVFDTCDALSYFDNTQLVGTSYTYEPGDIDSRGLPESSFE